MMGIDQEIYGKELILDMHECDPQKFTRDSLSRFFKILCNKIDMNPSDLHFWDYKGYPNKYKEAPDHLKGTSAVQFIQTSNITIHTLDILRKVFLNVFSCKDFDIDVVASFSAEYFDGTVVSKAVMERQ